MSVNENQNVKFFFIFYFGKSNKVDERLVV